ncbi:MAG: hypothetical protein ABI282_10265, partial [Candidatus Baltobacteraceae bacterium]
RGEKHDAVARDLGISRREFYRERRRALERLASTLEREFSTPLEPARIRPSEFELRLQYASSLHLVGRFDAALCELERSTTQDAAAGERIRALCYGVEVACDGGNPSYATRMLDSAADMLDSIEDDERESAGSSAFVALGRGTLAWRTGNIDEALRAYEFAARSFRPLATSNDRVMLDALVTTLLRIADVFSESGLPDKALAAVGEARSIGDRTPHPAILQRGDIAAALGSAHAVMTGGLSSAIDELQEAFAIYQRHHAIRRAVKTSNELSVLFMQREDFEASLRYGRTAQGVAQSVCSNDEFAYMCLNLSYAEARGGHPERALALTKQARGLVGSGSFLAALCTLADAEARLAAHQFDAAIRASKSANQAMTLLGGQRYVGAALRIEAEAHEKLGELPAAIDRIATAIDLLQGYGHPFSLVQAYRCSARVSGSHTHRDAAADLMATLQM